MNHIICLFPTYFPPSYSPPSQSTGPYTNAILRFQISFPETYPDRAPTVTFQQDVFHPLVTPLTTYTHSTRERGGGTLSAADDEKLPPGGLVLSGAFPEWFGQHAGRRDEEEVGQQDERGAEGEDTGTPPSPPHIASLLHFLRLAFTVPEILDEVPLALAANPSAWHAWRSHRAKVLGEQAFSPTKLGGASAGSASEGSGSGDGNTSPRAAAQPGGARRPGEWNWSGVWEDRVRKVVNASRAEGTLFGGEGGEVVSFIMPFWTRWNVADVSFCVDLVYEDGRGGVGEYHAAGGGAGAGR